LCGNKVGALCVDNWSQFGGPREAFFANIEKVLTSNIELKVERDWRGISMRLRGVLRRLFQRYTGYDIHKYSPWYGLDYWADISEILSKAGSVTAFDVGANLGQTVHKLVQVFPMASIHAFEPSPSTFSELSRALAGYNNLALNNCGVGSQKSEMEFVESTLSEMSSFLQPGPQIWGAVKQRIKVPITTVDDYSVEKRIERIQLLKIDTQGFEFEVIKGAHRMLVEERIDLVLTEITFGQLYEGLPRFDSIYAYMAQHGYRLSGVYDQARKKRILNWADVVFASPSIVRERADGIGFATPEEMIAEAQADAAFRDRCAAAEEKAAKIKAK
jgi:FkbM family methyltransferase